MHNVPHRPDCRVNRPRGRHDHPHANHQTNTAPQSDFGFQIRPPETAAI
jgi:hypothetical protein